MSEAASGTAARGLNPTMFWLEIGGLIREMNPSGVLPVEIKCGFHTGQTAISKGEAT